MNAQQDRVYRHARTYGGEAYAASILPTILAAPEARLHKALDAFVPDTITEALDPPKAYSKEKFTDE